MHQISMQILSLSNPKIPDVSPKRPKCASVIAEKRVTLQKPAAASMPIYIFWWPAQSKSTTTATGFPCKVGGAAVFFSVNLKNMPVNIFTEGSVNNVPVNIKMKMCPWTSEVPVNRQKSAHEFLKSPWTLSEKNAREPQKCPWTISKKSAREPPQTARKHVLPASGTVVYNYVIERKQCAIK